MLPIPATLSDNNGNLPIPSSAVLLKVAVQDWHISERSRLHSSARYHRIVPAP